MRRGFTLIELLVVMAIIALLASIILASLNSTRSKGRDARRISDIKQLQLALSLYYDQNGYFPTANNCGSQQGDNGTQITSALEPLTPFIKPVPLDPTNAGPNKYCYASTDGTNSNLCSGPTSQCQGYILRATLENSNPSAFSNGLPSGIYAGMNGVDCQDTYLNFCVSQ